jgi:hypothetical protein
MTRPPILQAMLDEAYAAFQHLPRPGRLDASPTHDSAQILALTSAHLKELEDDAIGAYAGSALWTIGGSGDYAYFLPRILELALANPVWIGAEPAVIAKKVQLAEWRKWRDAQQEAVVRVFETAFHSSLEVPPQKGLMAGEWLCGLVALGFDVEPYLAAWEQKTSPEAALQMACFANSVTIEADSDLFGGWWDEQPEAARRAVARWLLREERQGELIAAAGRFDADHEWEIDLALTTLESAVSARTAARTGGGAAGED